MLLGEYSFPMYLLQGKVIFGIFPYQNYSESLRLLVFVALFIVNLICSIVFSRFMRFLNVLAIKDRNDLRKL